MTQAGQEDAWAAWTDVARWSDGDVIERANLNGDFEAGSTIFSKPKGFPANTGTITRVDRPRVWVSESRVPGWRVTVEHVIERDVAGTKLTERMSISGPLGALIGRVVRRQITAVLVAMTEQIARQAEARSHLSREGAAEQA
jgi:hypothetical protein